MPSKVAFVMFSNLEKKLKNLVRFYLNFFSVFKRTEESHINSKRNVLNAFGKLIFISYAIILLRLITLGIISKARSLL